MVKVGDVAIRHGVKCLSADFNCTVTDPAYVIEILERLQREHAQGFERLLYVDVHGVSARKPLFLDESAHNWRVVRLGRELGWTGVALKTCKTQTGALLTACWAKAHGMQLMVQDLTNPMLAQIPHVLLAAQVGTIISTATLVYGISALFNGPIADRLGGRRAMLIGAIVLLTLAPKFERRRAPGA